MKKILNRITSLDLHLNYPAKTIVETKCVEDVACGIYPCYHMEYEDHLKVSTSCVALIKDSKKFILNPDFKPDFNKNTWYEKRHTIDKRIIRLKAFEIKTINSSKINFNPTRELKNKKEFIDKSIFYFKKFINDIEKKFPKYDHIIFIGGKDSQLIHLVPKLNPDRWHVFSGEPNTPLIKKWLVENKIYFNHFFVDNRTSNIEEGKNKKFFIEKILNSDCISDPIHFRWKEINSKISKFFDNKCIFWSGELGDTIYNCHIGEYSMDNYKHYFNIHFNRASSWQGNSLQRRFNETKCPILSMYHSPEIWKYVYQKFDPSAFEGIDLRIEIGNKLANKKIKWLKENPGPPPLTINDRLKQNALKIYIQEIKKYVKNEKRKSI